MRTPGNKYPGLTFLLAGFTLALMLALSIDRELISIYKKLAKPPAELTADPELGSANAPITMEIYSDFECPFCIRFAQETWPRIVKEYVATGKVKVVYKFLPLPFHPYARDAAKFAMCANYHGKFWIYHDLLYEHGRELSLAKIEELALQVGMTRDQIQWCLDREPLMEQKLDMVKKEADSKGIRGTPSFWINGTLVRGARPYEYFKNVLDSLLTAKK